MRLDGDSALSLNIHVIKQLIPEIALLDGLCPEQQLVGQGRLSVVNMSYNTEVSNAI
jgi:hypothetical protein